MRKVTKPWVMAKDGPRYMPPNIETIARAGMTAVKSSYRYAVNWNGTMTRVEIPAIHKYQRLSAVQSLILSPRYPPAKVPIAPIPEIIASHEPTSVMGIS